MSRHLTLAEQNDLFRSRVHIPQFGTPEIDGKVFITCGITSLPPITQIIILAKVRDFDVFSRDNDPFGEHDFGVFVEPGAGKIFWKIDYYDRDYRCGSPDPVDPKITRRVLTVMLADEY